MLVGLMGLRNRPRAEDDARDSALIHEVPHVAAEGTGTDRAVAAARRKNRSHPMRDLEIRRLLCAVVMVEELEPGWILPQVGVALVCPADGGPKGLHHVEHVAH